MKIFFDTEFHEDGRTIELISIGLVREDGASLYREVSDWDANRATPWLKEHVLPYLRHEDMATKKTIAREIVGFVGSEPEFWAYYANYDWVVLCQLYGAMINLPKGWPMYCRDIKQLCDSVGNPTLPEQETPCHHALRDAAWAKRAWQYLTARS